jgi:Gas vesicle synthesis protein GvpO
MAESTGESTDGNNERMPAADLAAAARESIEALTGYSAESVSALEWDNDRWFVTVDVCELERVPNTSDVIGVYVVQLDEQGGLLGYRRSRRYIRSQAEGV